MASSFCTASLWPSAVPKRPLIAEDAWSSFLRSLIIFPRDASRKSAKPPRRVSPTEPHATGPDMPFKRTAPGRLSRRSVCPVGAVSKMIRVNLAYSSFSTNSTTCGREQCGCQAWRGKSEQVLRCRGDANGLGRRQATQEAVADYQSS